MRINVAMLITATMVCGASVARSAEPAQASAAQSDPQVGQFIIETVQQGMANIQYSQLVLQRSDSVEVRQLAQRVLDSYVRTNRDLGQLASRKGVFIPLELSAEQRYRYQVMADQRGQAFDEMFVSTQQHGQESFAKMLESQLQNGSDEDVKAFAARTLQQLQSQSGMMKALADQGQF